MDESLSVVNSKANWKGKIMTSEKTQGVFTVKFYVMVYVVGAGSLCKSDENTESVQMRTPQQRDNV